MHRASTALLLLLLPAPVFAAARLLDFAGPAGGPRGAERMAFSPDGAHAYVTGLNAVTAFARAPSDGALGFVESEIDGVGGVDGLEDARGVAVSPDGAHVYVGSGTAVAVFARNVGTGELSFIESHHNNAGGIVGLAESYEVVVSPDGAHVYILCSGGFPSTQTGAVVVFARNAGTGSLTYVESERDEVNGVSGMRYATAIAISPDGAHVYAAGRFDSALATFARNATTGELTFLGALTDNQGGVDGLEGVASLAISPDGAQLYAAAQNDDSVAVFARNAGTGALTFLAVHRDGVAGVDGLNGSTAVAVSPDGAHVYAFGPLDDAVAVFARNAGTGALTFLASQVHAPLQTNLNEGGTVIPGAIALEPGGSQLYVAADRIAVLARNAGTGALLATSAATTLRSTSALALSPDGAHLYAASLEGTLTAFRRDAGTGGLEFVESEMDGIGALDALGMPQAVAVSPDGGHVYVAGGEDAVVVFARDAGTGRITLVETQRDGVGGVDGLDDPRGIAVSPDGDHVYVTGFADDAVAAFARDGGTGALTFLALFRDGIGGVDGLDGASSIAISPDGEDVYVTGRNEDALAVFARDAGTGLLTPTTVLRQGFGGIDGLDGASGLALSPDGANLYAVGSDDYAVVAFARDGVTGALTLIDVERNLENGVLYLREPASVTAAAGEVYVASAGIGIGAEFHRRLPEGTLDFVRSHHLRDAIIATADGEHVYAGVSSSSRFPNPNPAHFVPGYSGCTATPLPSCFNADAGRIVLGGSAANPALTWIWKRGEAVDPAELGDPGSTTHYAFCVYDESGPPALISRALVPAGGICRQLRGYYTPTRPCWGGSDGYKYRDVARSPEGLLSIRLESGGVGQSQVIVKGGKALLDLPAFPLNLPVRAQLQNSDGECWEATYSTPARNSAAGFSATPD